MKTLLFKLGQYLTRRFSPKLCKCHLDRRACKVHYTGNLEEEILGLYLGDGNPEWCQDFYRGWIRSVSGDSVTERITLCVNDNSEGIEFNVVSAAQIYSAFKMFRDMIGLSIKKIDLSIPKRIGVIFENRPIDSAYMLQINGRHVGLFLSNRESDINDLNSLTGKIVVVPNKLINIIPAPI